MKLDDFEQLTGLKVTALIAGALGAVVQLRIHPQLSKVEAGVTVLTGAVCAGYIGPIVHWLVSSWVSLPAAIDQPARGAANFFVGVLGMQFVAKLYTAVKDTKPADLLGGLRDFLRRVLFKDKQ